MNEKLTPEQIADDVAFIIQREMPDDVHSVDVAEIISAVQHYIIQQLTANTAEDEPKLKPGESIYQANRLSAEQEDK